MSHEKATFSLKFYVFQGQHFPHNLVQDIMSLPSHCWALGIGSA